MIANGYVDEILRKDKWLLNVGARLDYLHFNYEDKINSQLPGRGKAILSPKLNCQYTFNSSFQAYLKMGKGFHSNDARVVVANQGYETLPAAYGADLGVNWKPLPHLYINAALWYLYLQQEFIYDGDEGTIEPGNKTRRQGIDLSARYQINHWLFAIVDVNLSKARDIEAPKGSNYLPLAVPASSTGGLDFKLDNGLNGGLSYRYMKDRPANEDKSLIAKGYFVTDLTANYTKKKYEIGLEIQNLFNTKWREEQFEVESRLKNERQSVDEVDFTSGTPFYAKLKVAVFF
jgi:outer membrane receptor protein involved in Fe transport